MPFEEIETHTRQNAPPVATISYEHATEKSKRKGAKPRLTISVPTTICGTSKSKSFLLLIGSGADAGKIRIKGEKGGGGRASNPRNTPIISAGISASCRASATRSASRAKNVP